MLIKYLYDIGNIGVLDSTLAMFIWEMLIYSFMGWFYECTIFSLGEQGKIINKGYFIGPYCPIYGVVVALNVLLFSGFKSSWMIFICAALVCTVIEYITSYVMEQIFHERYWDYYYYPLNLNGRVSVPSSVFFGVTGLISVKILHPFMSSLLKKLPPVVLIYGAVIISILIISDWILTFICMKNISPKLRGYYDAWDEYVDGKLDVVNSKKEYMEKYAVVRKSQEVMGKAKDINQKCVEMEEKVKEYFRNDDESKA